MCGRFSLHINHDVQQLPGYDVHINEWIDQDQFVPRYNIAPRSQAPVIRRNDSNLVMQTMKWGLVPHWSKFEDKSLNTTNARSENLAQGGGMWASIKGTKRCAIPCQGYYEWLTKGKEKLPHFTRREDGLLLLMAGLYDSVDLDGKTLWTFTIVTTDANKDFSWLHDRQPVFLSNRDALERWLDTSSKTWTPELTQMVQPYCDTSVPLTCYQVPKEVGKVGTESASFIEPITNRKDGIEAMFSKQKILPSQPSSSLSKRDHDSTCSPSQSKELESSDLKHSSSRKRSKSEYNDEPEIAISQTSPSTSSKIDKKLKGSPTKRKVKQIVTSPGNAKVTSYFHKK
jgi:putative SOS response-associated peptidase YedK